MRKSLLLAACALLLSAGAYAGGYQTNSNQNAAFGRNLSQEAMIDILATYANPAGVGFLAPGWHFAFSNQSAFQTRTANSWFMNPQVGPLAQGIVNGVENTSATKRYKGTATVPIIPFVDLAYVENRWSLGFHFGFVGGGGKCEFEDGLGSFESKVSMLPLLLNSLSGSQQPSRYSIETYMRGKQYYFGGQLNGTYKVKDNLSVALGMRLLYATANYYGYVRNMQVVTPASAAPVDKAIEPMIQQMVAAVPALGPVMSGLTSVAGDVNLNCDQTGWGVTPIIGIDWRINKQWNVAAKYEFKTRLRLENKNGESASASALAQLDEYKDGAKVAADQPSILYVGAQYSPIEKVRINAGGHVYFDKQATQYDHREKELDGQSWEVLAGAEYDINKTFTVSAGWQTTHYGLGRNSKYISDMSFVCNSNSYGLGTRIHVSKKVALDISYFKTVYRHYNKYHEDYNNIKSNFGALLTPMEDGVTAVAKNIMAEDQAAGIDPQTDPRMALIGQLNTTVDGIKQMDTSGNDRLLRTNDVVGVGVIVNF